MQIKTVQSDLTLEKLIYFNSFYSLVHAASLIFQASYRCSYHQLDPKVALIMPIFTAVWCFVELFRLRLGSFGNRNESVRGCGRCSAALKWGQAHLPLLGNAPHPLATLFHPHPFPPSVCTQVPELSAFLVLTYLPQLPVIVWLSFVSYPNGVLPLDIATGIVQVAFLLVQGSYAWRTIRAIIGKQTADFIALCQMETASRQEQLGGGGSGSSEGALFGDAGAMRRRRARGGTSGSSRNLGLGESRGSAGSLSPQQQQQQQSALESSSAQANTSAFPVLPPLPPQHGSSTIAALAASREAALTSSTATSMSSTRQAAVPSLSLLLLKEARKSLAAASSA
jgi:hypothetical protein